MPRKKTIKKTDPRYIESLIGESSVGVGLMTVLTGISLLFSGIVLNRENITPFLLPAIFLIISTFAFFFSALLYANASGLAGRLDIQTTKDNKKINAEKALTVGNSISEYLGVFPFLTAVPLSVWALTSDLLITGITLLIDVVLLAYYQFSGIGISRRQLRSDGHRLFSYSFILLMSTGIVLVTQNSGIGEVLLFAELVLLLFAVFIAVTQNPEEQLD